MLLAKAQAFKATTGAAVLGFVLFFTYGICIICIQNDLLIDMLIDTLLIHSWMIVDLLLLQLNTIK